MGLMLFMHNGRYLPLTGLLNYVALYTLYAFALTFYGKYLLHLAV